MPGARKSMLYTRSGDAGTTALFGGGRVPKDSPRVEAYGCVDELNSTLGVTASFLRQRTLVKVLQDIQNELFNIGSELASETGKAAEAGQLFKEPDAKIAALERLIDVYDARVPSLRTFILPSGCRAPVARRGGEPGNTHLPEPPVGPALRPGAVCQQVGPAGGDALAQGIGQRAP